MNSLRSLRSCTRLVLVAVPLALLAAGCDNFGEKETPLKGDRRPLFPGGVPGVEFGAAPPQPSNSNVPIPSAMSQGETPDGPPQAQTQTRTQAAPPAQTARPTPAPPPPAKSAKAAKGGDPNDAWSGTR